MTHTSRTAPPTTGRALAAWGSGLAGCAGALALALLLSRLTQPLWGFGLPQPPHHVRPFLGIAALALFGLAQGLGRYARTGAWSQPHRHPCCEDATRPSQADA